MIEVRGKVERADARPDKHRNGVRLNGNPIEIPNFDPNVFAETLKRRKARAGAPVTLADKKARLAKLERIHGLA